MRPWTREDVERFAEEHGIDNPRCRHCRHRASQHMAPAPNGAHNGFCSAVVKTEIRDGVPWNTPCGCKCYEPKEAQKGE